MKSYTVLRREALIEEPKEGFAVGRTYDAARVTRIGELLSGLRADIRVAVMELADSRQAAELMIKYAVLVNTEGDAWEADKAWLLTQNITAIRKELFERKCITLRTDYKIAYNAKVLSTYVVPIYKGQAHNESELMVRLQRTVMHLDRGESIAGLAFTDKLPAADIEMAVRLLVDIVEKGVTHE